MITLPCMGQADKIDDLFAELQVVTAEQIEQSTRIIDQITGIWSDSGSASMDLLLKRGQDALVSGDNQAAVDHFSALVDHAPDFPEAYHRRAMAYFELGYFGPALADLHTALGLNPRHFLAMAGLGFILEDTGQTQKALETYRAAHALNPHDENVQKAIARLEGVAL